MAPPGMAPPGMAPPYAAPPQPSEAQLQLLRDEAAKLRAEHERLTYLVAEWTTQVAELTDELARQPQPRWVQQVHFDGVQYREYWYNPATGQTSWEMPTDAAAPRLSRSVVPATAAGEKKPEGPPGANLFVLRKKRKHETDNFFDDDLRALFEPYGNLIRADMAPDPNNPATTKGFGFVSFDNPVSATAAVDALHGKKVAGFAMVVEKVGEKAAK